MFSLKRSGLVWSLLICLVLMNGLMAAPSVAHAAHHATHQAGTHATGFCAWLCAAGQSIETSSTQFDSTFRELDLLEICSTDEVLSVFATLRFFRGPPASSL